MKRPRKQQPANAGDAAGVGPFVLEQWLLPADDDIPEWLRVDEMDAPGSIERWRYLRCRRRWMTARKTQPAMWTPAGVLRDSNGNVLREDQGQ